MKRSGTTKNRQKIKLICPNCCQAKPVEAYRLPKGKSKILCIWCCHQFFIDRATGLNCHFEEPVVKNKPKMNFATEEMNWVVMTPNCKGFRYNLQGLGDLILSGLVFQDTDVLPPGGVKPYPAGELPQLKPYFRQNDPRLSNPFLSASDMDCTDSSMECSKSFYDLDCSDFFVKKVSDTKGAGRNFDKSASGIF